MKIKTFLPILVILGLVFSSSACQPSLPASQAVTPSLAASSTNASPTLASSGNPYELISQESLFGYLEDLTSIQPFSGWRSSASSGEAEALDYVARKLSGFSRLKGQGLEQERQSFNVYLSTEFWSSGLTLTVDDRKVEVPAQGLRASRFDRRLAAYFDTDGILNDSNLDPVTAAGSPLLVRDEETLYDLTAGELQGRILFLDFSLMDGYVNSEAASNRDQLAALVGKGLAGVVLVTQYSNKAGVSHGTLLGDNTLFPYDVPSRRVPFLFVRIEDLSPAGIATWDDLGRIKSARLTLDTDVFSPGKAGNLIARIPGADPSKAVILGAQIDSSNGPGAFDDGSGSAALLEVARVLDVSQIRPPVDVYLAWFGGHEIGTLGSAYFASTHQELLDRTLAQVQMDCLGQPLDGKTSKITMDLTSYGRFGNESLPLPDFLAAAVSAQGISLDRHVEYGLIADNSNFDVFNVPNLLLIYLNEAELQTRGASYIHYSNHLHDPYETVERVRSVAGAFVGMTKVLLSAALEVDPAQMNLRVTPAPKHRALFVASHTESSTVITALLRELGMALAWEGFDVDLIPYGQAITPSDLENLDILVLPPTLDYPGPHLETWSEPELALLDGYVAGGGLLVVTNSGYNFSTKRPLLDDHNEDTRALNPLLEPMGITFKYGATSGEDIARAVSEHPLVANAAYLTYYDFNTVPFNLTTGQVLVSTAGSPLVALVDYGEKSGQVLVISDLGLLQADTNGARNMEFMKDIAHYAGTR